MTTEPSTQQAGEPLNIIDLDVSPAAIAALVADVDTHQPVSVAGAADRCSGCEFPAPCPTRFTAERTLYLIGFIRSPRDGSELREISDYLRWARDEVAKREAVPASHPEYGRVQASLPDLRRRLAEAETKLTGLLALAGFQVAQPAGSEPDRYPPRPAS